MSTSKPNPKSFVPGRRPWFQALRFAVACAGVGVTGSIVGLVWPSPDQVAVDQAPLMGNPVDRVGLSGQTVTLLLVGVDADALSDSSNGAAPPGKANADAVLLARFQNSGALRVLQIPTELAVQLPGSDGVVALSGLWQRGGIKLLRDAIAEIVGLDDGHPQRFVVMSRSALRSVVDSFGSIDLSLSQPYDYQDLTQNYQIKLDAGRQSLSGSEVEQLVRYRKNANDNANRRLRQQVLMRAFVDQLKEPEGTFLLTTMLPSVAQVLETNLSTTEMHSLAAAVVANPDPIEFQQLPLADSVQASPLRQLKPGQVLPLWPAS